MRLILIFTTLAATGSIASAAEQAGPASSGSLFTVLLGLILVLGLVAAAAWMLKRFGAARTVGAAHVKVVGGTSIGTRERILVVEVADQWIVVGVTPTQINTLTTMPRQELPPMPEAALATHPFAVWLKQTIDKRNDKQK
jgi:flagellar protein FliO/FliZ